MTATAARLSSSQVSWVSTHKARTRRRQLPWLRLVSHANPLTYLVHVLRGLMIGTDAVHSFGADFAVLAAVFLALLAIAARRYPTLVQ